MKTRNSGGKFEDIHDKQRSRGKRRFNGPGIFRCVVRGELLAGASDLFFGPGAEASSDIHSRNRVQAARPFSHHFVEPSDRKSGREHFAVGIHQPVKRMYSSSRWVTLFIPFVGMRFDGGTGGGLGSPRLDEGEWCCRFSPTVEVRD